MTRRVLLQPAARQDLIDHAGFIGQDSPGAASRFLDAARATLDDLARMPRLGRSWLSPHPALAGIRVLSIRGFANYLAFYRPVHGGIEVMRVLHGSQDIDALLER